jgi:hypothetical protein
MHYSQCYTYFHKKKECNWLKYLLSIVLLGLKHVDFTAVFIAPSPQQNHEQMNCRVSAFVFVWVVISCSLVGGTELSTGHRYSIFRTEDDGGIVRRPGGDRRGVVGVSGTLRVLWIIVGGGTTGLLLLEATDSSATTHRLKVTIISNSRYWASLLCECFQDG